MLKKIIIAGVILSVLTAGVITFIPWGEYESTIERSEVVKEIEKDSVGTAIPTLSLISGLHKVKSGEDVAAELLFGIDGLKKTKGAFEDFVIEFDIATEDYTQSKLIVTIQSASINTRNQIRDEHLLDPDFFHVTKYPHIVFESSEILKTDTAYIARGTLALLNTKKAIDVPFEHLGKGEDKKGNPVEAFQGSFKFDRTEYGMEEVSGAGNIVTVMFYCELLKLR